MGRKIGCDCREGTPAILDPAVVAVLTGERPIKRLMIQQGVTRPGWSSEAATVDEDVVCAALKILCFEILCKSGRHGRADAGADKDIKYHAKLAEGLVYADMRRSKASAAGRDVSNRAARQNADQTGEINLILQCDRVMHEAGQPSKPSRGSTDVTAPAIMNANEASRRPGVNLAGESLDIRQASHWRIAAAPEHNHVSLADSLARPGIGIAISEVNDQRRGVFKSVE